MKRHPLELTPEQLRKDSNPAAFQFKSTAELPPNREIIGQPRGVRAIEFGINMRSRGYNIYVMGPTGSGRLTAVEQFIRERAAKAPVPDDWVYVYNFADPTHPNAIRLPPGTGVRLRQDMDELIARLKGDVRKALESDDFLLAASRISRKLERKRDMRFRQVNELVAQKGFTIVNTDAGYGVVPLADDGQLLSSEAFANLPQSQQEALEKTRQELEYQLEDALHDAHVMEREAQEELSNLRRETVERVLTPYFDDLRERYKNLPDVLEHIEAVRKHILDNADRFAPQEQSEPRQEGAPPPGDERFTPYRVNVLVDRSDQKGAPVVVVDLPTYQNLVGRIEHRMQYGAMFSDFTMIRAGYLHQANGGFLVINAEDVVDQPFAWEALERALVTGEIRIEDPESRETGVMIPQTLKPEPIPLDVKVLLLGSRWLYYKLYGDDEDFPELFKVKADFGYEMDRTPENEFNYALFIAARCNDEGLPHFAPEAVCKVIDHGSRLAGDQRKLSTLFGEIADLVREAAYWASQNGHELVTAGDVEKAIREREYLRSLYKERVQEQIAGGEIFIDTDGEEVGQVNGLTVLDMGDYEFGHPTRITAQVFMGREGVVQVDREANMTGPIHNKAVLALKAYLGSKYAQDQPLSVSASLSFEQNYSEIEGDSASAAELYALLSALSGLPIKQSIAVTGSINQKGEVQPVGAVTTKIEGFFEICKARGLNGEHGVMVPRSNMPHLTLNDEVVQAVREGKFHIYAVETVDQGIELLTGVPAGERGPDGKYPEGTVHRMVQDRLRKLALDLDNFGRDHRRDEERDDSSESGEEDKQG